MGFLAGKKILICGLLSDRSIAYGIATACKREGAELAFTYVSEDLKDRVAKLAADFDSNIVLPCDVGSDEQIEQLFVLLKSHWDSLDGLVHSIAFAPRDALKGDYLDAVTRENFRISHDISSYSFAALAKSARPMLNENAGLITLSYLGAERAIPNYNVMGLAKASLEANVRFMAASLGSEKGIRVYGISAGPIKTLASAGISGFGKLLKAAADATPLKRNVSQEEVGNVAAFLMSPLASGMTGNIVHVDAGYSIGALSLGESA
ncbi:Enoyl-[acyl-carrier-protein] reductase [NADH] [Andreprevotia lacus DSM 23236]|uniref:Enoyl-[acyl-carrier-protein] reductase [NADH] n=1 Tax=Andreprevotia lacus DSM 23236 TaxID=1121001 RepID=A0A1W1XKM3_9NEIS|nr:SDR family oxidoreductase [Andreprevotia lacus]SMC24091.1 Enoyl-[acyl-carrier-protein] reductase [NADH] [Andreprevotia lacus DSM 23236]